jgi:hypothetical protein
MKKHLQYVMISAALLMPWNSFALQPYFDGFISYSPVSELVCSGNQSAVTATWSVAVGCTGGTPSTYTIRWYYNTTNSTVVAGATLVQTTTGVNSSVTSSDVLLASNITVPATAGTTYFYFAVATATAGCAATNPTTTVPVTNSNTAPVGGTATAASGSVGCGSSTTITLGGGYKGAIQWQISTDGGTTWFDIAGAMDAVLNTGALYGTTKFRAELTCGCPSQTVAYSSIATVTNSGTTAATWLTTGTTAWGTASNWNTGIVPTACTDVTIPSGGNQPTISAAASCHNITLNAGAILTRSSTLAIYGSILNNGTIASSGNFIDLFGVGTWGGSGVNGATFPVRIQNGADYTLTSSQTVSHLNHNGASATPSTNGHLRFGSNTMTVTTIWGCVFYTHFDTGMMNLMGGGSIDVTKSDYGTGILWVNSSVNNFAFNLEDDYYTVWFTNTAGSTKFGSAAIDVYVKQDLWIKNPCTLDLTASGTNAIVVGHDFINDDILSAATSTIRMQDFNVAQVQNVTSTNGTITTFNGLEVKNSGTGVYLQVDAATNSTATGLLTLTSGPLYLNSHKFTVQQSATSSIARNGTTQTGYIVSETNAAVNPSILQWNIGNTNGTYVIPFGVSSSAYIPLTFQKTAGNSSMRFSTRATPSNANTPWAGASSVAAVANMNRSTGDSSVTSVIDRWWDITAVAGTNSVTANVTFSYSSVENTLPVSPAYRTGPIAAQHWNGASWDPPVCSSCNNGVTSGIGTVTVSGANTFSPWILVAQSAPLPVTLLTFTASVVSEGVDLNWSTISEINNDFFTIERSHDGEHFEPVATVDGAGNSTIILNYSTRDPKPLPGISYYRLRQTDFNKESKLSDIVAVNYSDVLIIVSPNPAHDFVKVSFNKAAQHGTFIIELIDAKGNVVLSTKEYIAQNNQELGIDLRDFSPGIYALRIITPSGEISLRRFIRN